MSEVVPAPCPGPSAALTHRLYQEAEPPGRQLSSEESVARRASKFSSTMPAPRATQVNAS